MLSFPMLSLFLAAMALASPDPAVLQKAVEAQPTCQNSLHFDDNNLYLTFGIYRMGFEEPREIRPGTVSVAPLNDPSHPFSLSTQDGAIDSLAYGNNLFVLTYTGVEVWDLAKRQRTSTVPSYDLAMPWAYMEHARGIARYGDKAIIAHGRLGVSFFDLKNQRITNQFHLVKGQAPMESMAEDVTVQGKYAYVVVDDFTPVENGPSAFRGIVVIDMDSEQVVAELNGMDPGVDNVVSDGKVLIASFWGNPIWKYSLGSLRGRKMPEPLFREYNAADGHPIGKPSLDEVNYYTCYAPAPVRGPIRARHFQPKVFKRSDLHLE